jgi:cyclopropane-fatty-acyl-phospholipid synthase
MTPRSSNSDLAEVRFVERAKSYRQSRGNSFEIKAFEGIAETMLAADPSARFALEFWDGTKIGFGGQPRVTLRIKSRESARDVLGRGFMGFGEAYMTGGLEVDGDLQELLRLGLAIKFDEKINPLRKMVHLWQNLKTRNTGDQARRNVANHYDRGNELYALFLDETMAYSCAYFEGNDDTLEQAQQNKYDHIARKLALSPDDRLVDIGCGWGGMLIHAATKYGVRGVGVTLSRNQFEYANRKIKELGLEGRVQVLLEDYRELRGGFDKFVSIGMFEHVGKEYIPTFMRKARDLLKAGGVGLLHTIGKDVAEITDPWTLKYIFPGGYLPHLSEIARHMGAFGLSILDVENLRMHYALTLDRWAENFERNVDGARGMFGDVFVRMWRLYLHSSSANFKYGSGRLFQILFSNGLNNSLSLTRKHWYRENGKLPKMLAQDPAAAG